LGNSPDVAACNVEYGSAPPEMQALFAALRGNPDATNTFLSAITGAIPLSDFTSHENIGRIMAAARGASPQVND
jgi:hypothetical protein